MENHKKIRQYNTDKYNFIKIVQEAFNCKELDKIHEINQDMLPNAEVLARPWPLNETTTDFHSKFYSSLDNRWEELSKMFDSFIKNEIASIVNEPFIYQKFPSFRIQVPGLKAVNKWHCDSDENHRHPDGEINFIIAITKMFNNNTVWIESKPGLGDFEPLNLNLGEYVQFNGNKCIHGNKNNDTSFTRMSFDFRILPLKYYDPKNNKDSATKGNKFEIGGYYKSLD